MGRSSVQMGQRLLPLALPEQRKQHLILLLAPRSSDHRFARVERSDGGLDFALEMRPIQDLHRVGKVFTGLGFNPVGPSPSTTWDFASVASSVRVAA